MRRETDRFFVSEMLLLLLLTVLRPAFCLQFVVGPLIAGSSPTLDIMGVAAQLQERGHSVTVLVPEGAADFVKMAAARHSSNTTAEAMQYLFVNLGFATERAATAAARSADSTAAQHKQQQAKRVSTALSRYAGQQSLWQSLTMSHALIAALHDAMALPCSQVVLDNKVMQLLKALQPDAVMGLGLAIGDPARENCMCLMAEALGGVAAVDVYNGFMTGPVTSPQMGAVMTPAELKTPAGFAKNLVVWAALQALPLALDLNPANPWLAVRKQAWLPPAASSCALDNGLAWLLGKRGKGSRRCESVVQVVLGSWLLEYPRTLQPHQVLVGPGTPRLARPIISPPAVADFLAGATEGAVLVAFGSTSMCEGMLVPEDFAQLAFAFSNLAPVRVLWALKAAGLPDSVKLSELPLGSNTLIEPGWLDYNDVLGHPNTRAFVSHGGIHSLYEAIFHGVPVVGMPFIFEQADQILKLVGRGAAVISREAPAFRKQQQQQHLTQQAVHFTQGNVARLIQTVLKDPRYAAVSANMSAALQSHAKHRHPYERAGDAVELAVRSWRIQQELQQRQSHPPTAVDTGHHGGAEGMKVEL